VKQDEKIINDIISINLLGSIYLSRAVLRTMIQNKYGCIINIGSAVGLTGNIGQTVYSASKAGLVGFTKALSKEVGSRNIRVNCIAPGYIEDTEMTSDNMISSDRKKLIVTQTSLNKFGTIQDVVQAVHYVAAANFITGQVINIDGGLNM